MADDRDRMARPAYDRDALTAKAQEYARALQGPDKRPETQEAQAQRCTATTASGARCRAYAQTGRDWCYMHDPARSEERAAARRKGAREAAKTRSLEASPVEDVADWLPILAAVGLDVLRQELKSTNRARAICEVARTYATLAEKSDLEQRVAALEAKADGVN